MAEEWSSVQSTMLEVMACHNPTLSTPTTLLVACRKPSGRLWWCLLVELRVLVHLVLPQICHATPQILHQLRCRPVGRPRMPTGNSRPAQRIPAAPEPPDARPRGELKGPRDALLESQVSWPRSCRHLELGFTTPPRRTMPCNQPWGNQS